MALGRHDIGYGIRLGSGNLLSLGRVCMFRCKWKRDVRAQYRRILLDAGCGGNADSADALLALRGAGSNDAHPAA
jgi:hypothetical protein